MAAKKTTSLSEVKQIGTCNAIYHADNDDHMVPYVWYNRGDGVYLSWMEMLHPYAKNAQIYLHPAAATDQTSYGAACTTTANPKVVSHYCMPLWNPYNYYNWFGVVMWSGSPEQGNAQTSCAGTYTGCTEDSQVEGPSGASVLIPGYFITYNRPAPALESNTTFGSSCTTGFAPYTTDPPDSVRKAVQVFNDGGNYGMADTSARWMPTKRFNKDNSRVFNFSGFNYPASPYMFVK